MINYSLNSFLSSLSIFFITNSVAIESNPGFIFKLYKKSISAISILEYL